MNTHNLAHHANHPSRDSSAHKRKVINSLLTVTKIEKLSNNLLKVEFSCEQKLIVDPLWIGPHLKLLFPSVGQQEITFPQLNEDNKIIWQDGLRERVRTYSIRQYNESNNTLVVYFVIHQHGIATMWAQNAQVGDQIGLVAMGSKRQFDETSQLILLGDIAAMPAICYTLEHLPAKQKAFAIIEVRDEQDQVSLKLPANAQVTWLVTPPGRPSQLIEQIAQLPVAMDDSNLLFWGGMESSISQALRHYLKDRFTNLSSEATRLISYWREGYAEGQFKHHD